MKFCADYRPMPAKAAFDIIGKSLKHQPPGLCHSSLPTCYNVVLLWSLKKVHYHGKVPFSSLKVRTNFNFLLPVFISKLIFKKFIQNKHWCRYELLKKKNKKKI